MATPKCETAMLNNMNHDMQTIKVDSTLLKYSRKKSKRVDQEKCSQVKLFKNHSFVVFVNQTSRCNTEIYPSLTPKPTNNLRRHAMPGIYYI